MSNQMQKVLSVLCVLSLVILACVPIFGTQAEMVDSKPKSKPASTPDPETLGKLIIHIEGPDARMPMDIPYSSFTDGEFELTGLTPGTYTITEIDPDKLLEGYTYLEGESVRTIVVEIKDGMELTGKLVNKYELGTPTPEPTETPTSPDVTPTPTPIPEKIKIPVVKKWVDDNNKDGNRPASVRIHLLADGKEVDSATLNSKNNWAWTFENLDKYNRDGTEIKYTLKEDPVPLYVTTINGFTITNHYNPETTTVTITKIWNDNDNEGKMRPISIFCKLSNGMSVKLDASNNWTATISNLPTIVNGKRVTYTWTEQEVLGYEVESIKTTGAVTIITNRYIDRPDPPEGKKTPPTRGTPYITFEEYGTPLGLEVIINHVGDCFD